MSVLPQVGGRDAFAELSRFRTAFYSCLSARADAFFELTDALLCTDGPTRAPVELLLLAEQQRGYGSPYGAVNRGRLDIDALHDLLMSLRLLSVDVENRVDDLPQSCTRAAVPGPARFALQAVNTGSIKAQRASDTSLRYGRRALTLRATTVNATHHKNIPEHQPSRSDALLLRVSECGA